MSPRPILKRSAPNQQLQHPHHYHVQQLHTPMHHNHHHHHQQQQHAVHFPPSPALTRTFSAYSAAAYDRSPIVVSPNSCALPERGCPGRTYFDEAATSNSQGSRGINFGDYHPRALVFASSLSSRSEPSSSSSYPSVPQLVPDLSSESEESDGFYGIPTSSSVSFGIHGLAIGANSTTSVNVNMSMHTYSPCDEDAAASLAFLPYSPSSPSPTSYAYEDAADTAHKEKPRRRRGERERRHESSRDPDRIRSSPGSGDTQFALAFGSLSVSPPSSSYLSSSPPHSPTKKSSRKPHYDEPPSFSPSAFADDGCLGGF